MNRRLMGMDNGVGIDYVCGVIGAGECNMEKVGQL